MASGLNQERALQDVEEKFSVFSILSCGQVGTNNKIKNEQHGSIFFPGHSMNLDIRQCNSLIYFFFRLAVSKCNARRGTFSRYQLPRKAQELSLERLLLAHSESFAQPKLTRNNSPFKRNMSQLDDLLVRDDTIRKCLGRANNARHGKALELGSSLVVYHLKKDHFFLSNREDFISWKGIGGCQKITRMKYSSRRAAVLLESGYPIYL